MRSSHAGEVGFGIKQRIVAAPRNSPLDRYLTGNPDRTMPVVVRYARLAQSALARKKQRFRNKQQDHLHSHTGYFSYKVDQIIHHHSLALFSLLGDFLHPITFFFFHPLF